MLDFEEMNKRVYGGDEKPDDLALPELVAWEGLEYVYALLGLGKRSRDECAAIKIQIGKEYQSYIDRFEKIERDMAQAIAVWKAARMSDHPAVKALVDSVC